MNPLNPEDIQDLKQLIEFLKENQVAEFELDRGEFKVRLKFSQPESAGLSDLAQLLTTAQANTSSSAAAQPLATELSAVEASAADPFAGLHVVKSPIVGTFYGAPTPGAAPFVSAGERVEKGQVLGIIEAMKLMNEIESDASGEIVKCLVANGQPIEFGQPLFTIKLG